MEAPTKYSLRIFEVFVKSCFAVWSKIHFTLGTLKALSTSLASSGGLHVGAPLPYLKPQWLSPLQVQCRTCWRMTSWNPFFHVFPRDCGPKSDYNRVIPSPLIYHPTTPAMVWCPTGWQFDLFPRYHRSQVEVAARIFRPSSAAGTCMCPSVLMIQNADMHRAMKISMILSTSMIWTLDISNDFKWYGDIWRVCPYEVGWSNGCATAQRCPLTHDLWSDPWPPKVRTLSMACPKCPRTVEFQLLNSWFQLCLLRPWHAICRIQPLWGFSAKNEGFPSTMEGFKTLFSHENDQKHRGQLPKFCQATAHALSWWQAAGPGRPRRPLRCWNHEAG